jgi:hypothetical protein
LRSQFGPISLGRILKVCSSLAGQRLARGVVPECALPSMACGLFFTGLTHVRKPVTTQPYRHPERSAAPLRLRFTPLRVRGA